MIVSLRTMAIRKKYLQLLLLVYTFFLDRYQDAFVFAMGSTNARRRLYRMGITKFYEEVERDFYLSGRIRDSFYHFEKGVEYSGFLVQRKFD